jgi:biopolymer transport protein ExbB
MIAMFILADSPFQTIPKFFEKGGWFMVPLAICSLVAVTIALLRAFALRRESVLPAVVESEIERFQPGGSAEQLARLVGDDPAALSCLTRVALNHVRVSRAENSEAVQTRARREIMRLEGGLAVLELIVGISPLLGLLGAISGLVNVFSNLGTGKAAADTVGVALGIAEALNTTIFGLAIAIPTLIVYTYFAKKVEAMSVEMESLMADLLSKCYYRKPVRPGASPVTEEPDYDVTTPSSYVPQARRLAQAPVTQSGGTEGEPA